MRVMVIGGGGREHTMVETLVASPQVTEIFALPGSDAIGKRATCLSGDPLSPADVVAAAQDQKVDLVLVGPEAPLAAGVVDGLQEAGIPAFGPTKQASQLEWSKAYAKAFMERHGIPTAPGKVFDDPAAAEDYIRSRGGPIVVKADGLAAGKGVVVAADTETALEAVDAMMRRGQFGESGRRVIVEERLQGPEVTLLAFTDGETVRLCPASQDHKALFDGGQGPNTGGMGAYSPVPFLDPDLVSRLERDVLQRTVAGMAAEGIPFRGVLYAGMMLTEDGPYVLEYNCRLGDPEAQVILPCLESDFAALALACAQGGLAKEPWEWRDEAAVCVVLSAHGYPGEPRKGDVIQGLDETGHVPGMPNVQVFHAGTRWDPEKGWVTNGGRILNVVARGPSLAGARETVYAAIEKIHFDGMHYRRDIAAAAAG